MDGSLPPPPPQFRLGLVEDRPREAFTVGAVLGVSFQRASQLLDRRAS